MGESGTPHLQGFISFAKRTTFNNAKAAIHPRAHVEPAKGKPHQAAEYCKKDGAFTEFGKCPVGRGKRSDLDAIREAIAEGATETDIRDSFFGSYLRYERVICKVIAQYQTPRTWETNVIVLWGKTGTGKTRSVWDYHSLNDIYVHTGTEWFNGYSGQPIVLFDDFNGSEFKLAYFLRLLDRYPMQVQIKGGYVNWVPKTIYITSNKNPTEWYSNCHEEQRQALFRRLKEIKEFT